MTKEDLAALGPKIAIAIEAGKAAAAACDNDGGSANLDRVVIRIPRVREDAVKDLPEEDRTLATAMLQALHTTPWLEMREHWGLDGEQIARASGWAIRTLLADLKARGGKPLGEA